MSDRRDATDGEVHEKVVFQGSPEALFRAVEQAADLFGLQFKFDPNSNPVFHFHFHHSKEQNITMGDEFNDKSSGPTGAKAFGAKSRAVSHGDVGALLGNKESETVLSAIQTLCEQLNALHLSDPTGLEEVRLQLAELAESIKSKDAKSGGFLAVWTKAKTWITSALGVGAFVAESAAKVRGTIEQIDSVLSCVR